jgi:hypothetical protein
MMLLLRMPLLLSLDRSVRFTPDCSTPDGFFERACARLKGQGPSKEKDKAEVALLKAQAKLCEEKMITEKAATKGAEITNRAAQIANLNCIMETGELGDEEMAACRKRLYVLAMDIS